MCMKRRSLLSSLSHFPFELLRIVKFYTFKSFSLPIRREFQYQIFKLKMNVIIHREKKKNRTNTLPALRTFHFRVCVYRRKAEKIEGNIYYQHEMCLSFLLEWIDMQSGEPCAVSHLFSEHTHTQTQNAQWEKQNILAGLKKTIWPTIRTNTFILIANI